MTLEINNTSVISDASIVVLILPARSTSEKKQNCSSIGREWGQHSSDARIGSDGSVVCNACRASDASNASDANIVSEANPPTPWGHEACR